MPFAAQAVFSPPADPLLLLGVAAALVVLLGLGLIFLRVMRYLQRGRELLHQERMKALELGQATGLPDTGDLQEKYAHNAFCIACWMGAGVPTAVAWAAAWVAAYGDPQATAHVRTIWICVAVIGVASVVCATVVAVKARGGSSKGEKTSSRSPAGGDVS